MGTDFFDELGRSISNATEIVGKKTGEVVEVIKLKNQIYSLEREMKNDYSDLGKMIYERYANGKEVDESFAPICEAIAQKEILIDQYQGEIDILKSDEK